jgi:hypothetical protein
VKRGARQEPLFVQQPYGRIVPADDEPITNAELVTEIVAEVDRLTRYDDAPARGEKPPPDFGVPGATELRFSGDDYVPELDAARLAGQIERVYSVLSDGDYWWTLDEIEREIRRRFDLHDPEPSISAQIRHLRKPRFGSHSIEKRRRGEETGLFEYRLVRPEPKP